MNPVRGADTRGDRAADRDPARACSRGAGATCPALSRPRSTARSRRTRASAASSPTCASALRGRALQDGARDTLPQPARRGPGDLRRACRAAPRRSRRPPRAGRRARAGSSARARRVARPSADPLGRAGPGGDGLAVRDRARRLRGRLGGRAGAAGRGPAPSASRVACRLCSWPRRSHRSWVWPASRPPSRHVAGQARRTGQALRARGPRVTGGCCSRSRCSRAGCGWARPPESRRGRSGKARSPAPQHTSSGRCSRRAPRSARCCGASGAVLLPWIVRGSHAALDIAAAAAGVALTIAAPALDAGLSAGSHPLPRGACSARSRGACSRSAPALCAVPV